MTTSNPRSPGTNGGSGAIRGFLVQTLVALLEVVNPESSVTEIALEPAVGDDQFDFLWKNKDGSYATQVKSTLNSFTKADVEKWADKLRKARTDEKCTLMLVGHIPPALVGLNAISGVTIETKHLHLGDLVEQAAQRLAKFLESEQMLAGTALQREMVVHALTSRLEHLAAKSEPLSRESFLGLLRQWVNSAPRGYTHLDLSHFTVQKYAPAELVGRKEETAILDRAWLQVIREEKPRPHILTFVALGGEGKTSLVSKWVAELAAQDWPGCDAAFAWSFYSQGTREQQDSSSDLFLKEALTFFGDDADKAFAASPADAFEKGQRLARIVGQRRSLLILDGLEPLQYAPTAPTSGELKDQGIAALLKGLAAASHGLCIVTTRYSLPDLRAYWQTTALEKPLLRLSTPAGVHLLQRLGVRKESGSPAEFAKLVEDVKGHALTLNLLGTYLRDAHAGDIRKRDLVKLTEVDAEEHGGHAGRVMDAYVISLQSTGQNGQRALAMLRLLGLFERPATAGCLGALWGTPAIAGLTEPLVEMSEAERNCVLTRLEDGKLLTVNRAGCSALVSLDAHPLIRAYFARQLREQQPNAWRTAHRRLYEYLCASTPDKSQPRLEDLQPLFQAVAHGCQAGAAEEACIEILQNRIQRGKELYSRKRLGATGSDLGALFCFFESAWETPLPQLLPGTRSWVLGEASFCLLMLGRHPEAVIPRQIALKMNRDREAWNEAAIHASYLGELRLQLGNIDEALRLAQEAEALAMRCDDPYLLISIQSTVANAFHHSGQRSEALSIFRKAENLQAEREPKFPLLYTDWGAMYCDLLLAGAEREGWLRWCRASWRGEPPTPKLDSILGDCRSVEQRATQTLASALAANAPIRSPAKDHLTLGRVALYVSLLSSTRGERHAALKVARKQTTAALAELRVYGSQAATARALLTDAWLRFLEGDTSAAQSDLNDAWEIAERGSMKIYMADIHLHRARLFFREKEYPWKEAKNWKGEWVKNRSAKDDLTAAEELINECGYHRRDEELSDAKRAILDLPFPQAMSKTSRSIMEGGLSAESNAKT